MDEIPQGTLSPDRTRYESCPLCEGTPLHIHRDQRWDWQKSYNPKIFPIIRWMECESCGHIFAEGPLKHEVLETLFSHVNAGQSPGANSERSRLIWAPTVKEVARLRYPGRWLDVGFGNGALLEVAAEWGFNVVGLDSRAATVRAMQQRGVSAVEGGLEKFGEAEEFDVVSLCDVLEHLPDPRATLRQVEKILRPGGILLLSMPNRDSSAWRDLDKANVNPYWSEIEHLHNFSRETVVRLLSECGLTFVSFDVPVDRWRLGMQICARKPEEARSGLDPG